MLETCRLARRAGLGRFGLWSEQYDGELADVFNVQSQISKQMRHALRLNPKPSHSILAGMSGGVDYAAGRKDRAIEHWQQARSANPDMILARIGLAAHYESVGRHEEAQALVEEILRVNPNLTTEFASTISLGREEWPTLLRRAGLP